MSIRYIPRNSIGFTCRIPKYITGRQNYIGFTYNLPITYLYLFTVCTFCALPSNKYLIMKNICYKLWFSWQLLKIKVFCKIYKTPDNNWLLHGIRPWTSTIFYLPEQDVKILVFLWTIMYGARAHIFCIRNFFQVGTLL